jgi:hypothetical protein
MSSSVNNNTNFFIYALIVAIILAAGWGIYFSNNNRASFNISLNYNILDYDTIGNITRFIVTKYIQLESSNIADISKWIGTMLGATANSISNIDFRLCDKNIDPRLMSKIDAAIATGSRENITAIISIAQECAGLERDTMAQENLVNDLLLRTEHATQEKPASMKYLPNLGILIVEGNATFLRKLIESPEISSATSPGE